MLPLKQQTITVQLGIDQLGQTPQSASYLDTGSGPLVLMLHGFMGNKACWLPLIEQLKSHYRCISLDLLGFGESGKPKIRYDVALEVAFVRQVVLALQLDPCYILGHSFGGWVAAAYGLQYPASVSGLLLAAPGGIRDDSFCGRYDHLRPLLWQIPIVDWALQLAKPLAQILGKRESLDKISWFRGELNAQPAARSFLVDRMRPEDAVDTVEKDIHQLRVPTLVLSGDRDETIPLWHSQTYANEIPGAQLAIIPNASHSLPQDYASELATLILPFLELQNANAL
jgi:pimeloyl-ACP methyl ester carboxylesterase